MSSVSMTHLDIPCCSSLLEQLLPFFPGTITVLASGNSELCPPSNGYFWAQGFNAEVITQSISLTNMERMGSRLSCMEKHESSAKISQTARQLSIVDVACVQIGYQGFECVNPSTSDSTL